mgnify:CR=1 FL=1
MSPTAVANPKPLTGQDKDAAMVAFLVLSGLFVASLVSCNLVFRKFFSWDLGGITFEQSVGLLPYPLTFLITDMISEIFGKRKANLVVLSGLAASIVVLLIISMASATDATTWSPVSNQEFDHVFGQTALAVGASMAAYLLAQLIDVRIFHFWKHLTEGKHLWLRNNLSTIPSQLVDTATVLVLLCAVGEIGWDRFGTLFVNGMLFKSLVAAADTPLIYLGVGWMRRRFHLAEGQEIEL